MRTTLTIDDDLLLAAKEVAAAQHRAAGAVLSEWARRGLHAPPVESELVEEPIFRNGFEVFPSRGHIVTPELVRRLQDESEDL